MSRLRACVGSGSLLLLVAWGCDSQIERPPGVLIDRDPIQRMYAQPRRWESGEFVFEAIADYDIEARVLHRDLHWVSYWFPPGLPFGVASDFERLSPLDLALGWGARVG
jgi:hypothetical protein